MRTRLVFFLGLLFILAAGTPSALAISAADHDAFFLGAGTANITVKNSDDLISGTTFFGGYRVGLFSIFFLEIGYGTVGYSKTVEIGGVMKDITFRTTGPNGGVGFLLPIRKTRLGLRYVRNPRNKWSEVVTDVDTLLEESNISGDIDYTTRSIFGQFANGTIEVGMREEEIRESNSVLDTSFGVYFAYNIKLM